MAGRQLRIAFLSYKGNPHSGGQGVYTRNLTRELRALGHHVEVFSGQPYPVLDEGVGLTEVPSLDLFREPDPFRTPFAGEFRDWLDVGEFAMLRAGGFPEPLTFSVRARRALQPRRDDFDLIHDNQCLGSGVLGLADDGWPVVATIHHPITVDRALDFAHAATPAQRESVRRWYSFAEMQTAVARKLPRILTVSSCSAEGLAADMGIERDRIEVVPVGVDAGLFRPLGGARTPGLIVATASSDSPLKGLVPLVEALAKLRVEHPDAQLTIVGRRRLGRAAAQAVAERGLEEAVTVTGPVNPEQIVELYARAQVAVVPSLYEGFSLPAIEAMACEVPLVATTGGALPEVVGADGEAALLVPPGDPSALAAAIARVLSDARLARRLGPAGRARVLERFTWQATAEGTAEQYRRLLDSR